MIPGEIRIYFHFSARSSELCKILNGSWKVKYFNSFFYYFEYIHKLFTDNLGKIYRFYVTFLWEAYHGSQI